MATVDNGSLSPSAYQVRPPTVQSRASRLIQKVSSFKDRIWISSRKTKDVHEANNPYQNRTRSVDGFSGGVKPYMSHPMLGLANMLVEPFSSNDQDGDDSSTSYSPARSEVRRSPVNAPPSGLPRDSTSPGAWGVTAVPSNFEGLPPVATTPYQLSSNERPSTASGMLQTASRIDLTPEIIISNPSESMLPLNRTRSSTTLKEASKRDATNTSLGRALIRKLSRPRLQESTHKPDSDQDVASKPMPPLPVSSPATIAHSASLPDPLLDSHPLPPIPPIARRDTAPRLTLPPPNHRFSLTLLDGSARLSPSVIIRPPPLMRLPTLPPIPPPSGTLRGRPGLRNMPELPCQGSDRGSDCDDEDMPEDGYEDEGNEDSDEDFTTRNTNSSLSNYDDESFGRPSTSMSGSVDGGMLFPPSTSSRRSHSRSSSYASSTNLPTVDTSRIDLTFLDRPPSPPPKGKGKARAVAHDWAESDNARTPTSVSPYRDYFSSRTQPGHGGGIGEEKVEDDHISRDDISPARTPRAGSARRAPFPSIMTSDLLSAASPRPKIYKHASRSLIDIHAIEKKERVEKMVMEEEAAQVERRKSIIIKPGKVDFNEGHMLPTVEDIDDDKLLMTTKLERRISKAPAYDSIPNPLRRRRSMPMFTESSSPPPYPSFVPFAHPMSSSIQIQPRDDEGRERLPSYTNEIYVKTILPRKMEFIAPGVQAKDRKWRRVMCVLEGTSLKIYRCPAGATGVSAIGEWWEKKVGVGDVSAPHVGPSAVNTIVGENSRGATEGVPKLGERGDNVMEIHVPASQSPAQSLPTRDQFQTQQPSATRSRLNLAVQLLKPSRPHSRSVSDATILSTPSRSPRPSLSIPRPGRNGNSSSRPSITSTPENLSVPPSATSQHFSSEVSGSNIPSPSRSQFRAGRDGDRDPDFADLIRAYTMQNAESGLGNDYVKRKNVIRVRVEGEQFLLQARDVACVVEWIEALQASANIALDLDERPMPKGPLFPRRRRRRGVRRPITDTVEPSRPSIDHTGTIAAVPASTINN